MDAVDTNVVIRYLTADHEQQFLIARRFIESGDAKLINSIVLVELSWVLSSVYQLERAAIADTLEKLLTCGYFVCTPRTAIKKSIGAFKQGYDLADALLATTNREFGAQQTVTFDKKASDLEGFQLLSN